MKIIFILKKFSFSSELLVKLALNYAKEARKNLKNDSILIAGSNGPLGDTYYNSADLVTEKQMKENHSEHIKSLFENGADLILNETFSKCKEIKIVGEICEEMKIPFIISIFCSKDLKLIDGEHILKAIEIAKKFNCLAISFNCIQIGRIKEIIKTIPKNFFEENNWGCYLNNFKIDNKTKQINAHYDYIDYSQNSLKNFMIFLLKNNLKPSFFGGCCGTNPFDTLEVSNIFK